LKSIKIDQQASSSSAPPQSSRLRDMWFGLQKQSL